MLLILRASKIHDNDFKLIVIDFKVPLDINRLRNDGSLPKTVSLQDWLVHIGLPMFIDDLLDAGIDSIFDVSDMSIEELKQVSVCDEKHMALLIKEAKNQIQVLN